MLTDFQELWPTNRKSALPKSNELQSINVVKTCEKLRLAITRAYNGLQRTQDISHKRSGEELSFRSISRLCYTTLRIHELQVNDLLNKSKELVAQSKDWPTVKAKKRSLPTHYSTTYNAKRKRRATVEHSLQDFTITDYTALLDETAKFVEWGKTTEIVNKKVLKTKSHNRTTCIHIREITINEFDTHNEQYFYDEDDGFGNTTSDELATIIQLLADEPAKAPKRKAADKLGVYEKKPKNNDELQEVVEIPEIEIARSAVVEHETSSLFMPALKNNCDDSNVNELSPVRVEMGVMHATDCSVVSENNDNYVEVRKSAKMDKLSSIPNGTNKICNYHKESVAPNESLKKSKSKHSKTIIDAFTALTQSEMRAQMQIQINVTAKLRKIRAKVKWNNGGNFNGRKHYEKLLPSAKQLLTTLQHNCIANRKFKLKNKARLSNLKSTTASDNYRNLLREILNCEITDDLATQIYKKWNHTEKRNLGTINNLTNYTPSVNAEMIQDESSLLPNSTMEIDICNDNNNNLQHTNRICSPSNEQDEWGAYDVMIKLLSMWRSQIMLDDEISVEFLLPQTAMSRKAAAKAFGALLRLAANGFIMLFTAEHTTHLRCIKLGVASNKHIEGIGLNNETDFT
nr:uncharacterized protein LOC106616726 isoform X1 [Bactrocera oleae]